MDEFKIAASLAAVLNRLSFPDNTTVAYDEDDEEYYNIQQGGQWQCGLGTEELKLAKLRAMTAKLAMSRAIETHQEFETVLKQTELTVTVELARILAKTIDPVLNSLETVKVEKGKEYACGVCLEDLEVGCEARAMGCKHVFHAFCIVKWLKQNASCPLCRYEHHVESQE